MPYLPLCYGRALLTCILWSFLQKAFSRRTWSYSLILSLFYPSVFISYSHCLSLLTDCSLHVHSVLGLIETPQQKQYVISIYHNLRPFFTRRRRHCPAYFHFDRPSHLQPDWSSKCERCPFESPYCAPHAAPCKKPGNIHKAVLVRTQSVMPTMISTTLKRRLRSIKHCLYISLVVQSFLMGRT